MADSTAPAATDEKTPETKREHFKRLAEARVTALITAADKLAKLGNRHLYEYSEEDVTKIEEACTKSLSNALTALKSGGTVKSGFTLGDD